MTLIYIITRFLTFPGALVRGLIEHIVCRIHKTVIEDNRYIRTDENCSHIEHELMSTPGGAFAVCFVPMLFQIFLAACVSLAAATNLLYLGCFSMPYGIIDIVCLWVGFSLTVNCFPSVEDALNMWEKLYKTKGHVFQKIIFAPGAVICFVGAYLEKYCLTFVSGIVLTVILAFAI